MTDIFWFWRPPDLAIMKNVSTHPILVTRRWSCSLLIDPDADAYTYIHSAIRVMKNVYDIWYMKVFHLLLLEQVLLLLLLILEILRASQMFGTRPPACHWTFSWTSPTNNYWKIRRLMPFVKWHDNPLSEYTSLCIQRVSCHSHLTDHWSLPRFWPIQYLTQMVSTAGNYDMCVLQVLINVLTYY